MGAENGWDCKKKAMESGASSTTKPGFFRLLRNGKAALAEAYFAISSACLMRS
jgi:hypothetical protein